MKIVAHILRPVLSKFCLLLFGVIACHSTFAQTCFHAEFSSELGYDGCTVYFTDQSVGDISSWEWQFGDGGTSTQQSPSHYYSSPGCYNVILTITQANETKVYSEQVCPTCVDGSGTGSFFVNISGPPNVYVDGTYNFGSAVSGGVPPFDYFWQVEDTNGSPSACGQMTGGGYDEEVAITFPSSNCSSGDSKVIVLQVTDNFGNLSTATLPVNINGSSPDCEIDVSGSLDPGETTKFKIHATFLGTDCFDVYPYWTWNYGDGSAPEGPMFWVTWHDYQEAGTYTVTATGCVEPYESTNCVTVVTTVTIGPVPEPPSGPYFFINPSETIDATIGEPLSEPLTVGVNFLPEDNFPNHFEIEHYEVRWKFIDSYTNALVHDSYPIGPIPPSQLMNSTYTLTPTTGMYGCLDVILEVYPWGYYNGQIDLNCDGELTGEDNGCGGPCYGYVGANTPINLGTWNNQWSGQTGGATGCVGDDVEYYGENFPFTVRENCKIDVFYEPINVLDIEFTENCFPNPHLEVVTEKGAIQSSSIPNGAPCSGTQNYQNYEWKAFDINDQSIELENFFSVGQANNKCVYFDRSHPYFQQFQENQLVVFICEVTVTDYFGVKDTHTKLIGLDLPLRVNVPGEINVCPGTSGIPLVEGSLAIGGDGNYTFGWSNGASTLLESVGSIPIFPPVFDVPASYSGEPEYILTVTDGTGCSSSKNIKFNVSNISATITTDQTTLCIGQGLNNTLNADITGGSGNYDYQWFVGGATIDDPTAANPVITPTGQSIICQLTVTDEFGCSASDNASLSASTSNPVADIWVYSQPNRVCYGSSLTLGGKGDPGSGVLQRGYSWTSSNPLFIESDEVHPILTPDQYDEPGLYTYTLTVYDETNGCFDQATQYVELLPQWEWTGFESEVRAVVEGAGPPIWSSDDNKVIGGPGNSYTYEWIPSNPFTIVTEYDPATNLPMQGLFPPRVDSPTRTLRVEGSNKCTKDFISNRYLVLEEEAFLHVAAEPSGAVCQGEEICLTISLYSNYIGDSPWLLPPSVSGIVGTNSSVTLNLIDGSVGVYQGEFCFTAWGATGLPVSVKTAPVEINDPVFGVLNSEITYVVTWVDEAQDIEICIPNNNSFVYRKGYNIQVGYAPNSAPNCDESYIGDGWVSNFLAGKEVRFVDNLEFYTGVNAKSHSVISPCIGEEFFTNPNEIISVDTSKVIDAANIREVVRTDKNASLHIQPNPFSESFEIFYEIDSAEKEMVRIEIYHITGHLVDQVFDGVVENNSRHRILYDGTALQPGIYLCRMQIGDAENISQRIIKVNP